MSPNAPLTNEQRNAVTQARAIFGSLLASLRQGTAESVEKRARRPSLESLPADVAVRIEIAPPSTQPHPLLVDTGVLKALERVPIYFYALRSNCTDSNSSSELEPDADPGNTRVIFFIHGGGNVTGHPTDLPFVQFYARLLRGVATAAPGTKWVFIAPSYRLATVPENVFPAALQDLVAAYDYVLSKGYDASNLFIAGDSTSGNHAIVLTHLVLHANKLPPRGVVAIAPSAIQMFDDARVRMSEDILEESAYEGMMRAYVGDSGVSLLDPLVSGAFLSFASTWPRTLILVGTADRLIDGVHELERHLVALGRPVELVEYDGRPHGWWVLPHIFPENVQDGVERISRFLLN